MKWEGLAQFNSVLFESFVLPNDAETSKPVDVEKQAGSEDRNDKAQTKGKGKRTTRHTITMTEEEIDDQLQFVSGKQKKQGQGE